MHRLSFRYRQVLVQVILEGWRFPDRHSFAISNLKYSLYSAWGFIDRTEHHEQTIQASGRTAQANRISKPVPNPFR